MRKTERDGRWEAAGLAGILLLGIIGCTRVIEHKAPASSENGTAPATASNGLLSDYPTEPPAAAATGDGSVASDGGPAVADVNAELEGKLRVHEIQVASRDGREALIIVFSRPPARVRSFALSKPNRIVLDFDGPLAATPTQTHPVAGSGIARVRIGSHEGQLRLVADVNGILPDVDTDQQGRIVVAMLGPASGSEDQLVYRAPGVATVDVASAQAPRPVPPAEPAAALADTTPPPAPEPAAVAEDTTPPPAPRAEVAHAEPPPPAAVPDPPAKPIDEPFAKAHHTSADPAAEAYALPVQAKTGAKDGKATATAHIEGGTVSTLAPREYSGQRISLDFKDADIQNVLRILADVSGLNIITTEEVQGKLTMRLVDVPWDQAFDAILRAKNLDSVRDGNIIRVSTVKQLKEERETQRAADDAQKAVEPLEVRYLKVNYAKADEKMVKKIQEVLSDRGSATWDERTNMIVVRDIASGVANARELVEHFDTQTPQVLIESNIVEAQKNFLRDLGIQWGVANKAGPGTGNSTGMNFPGTINAGGILAGGKNSPATTVPFIADFPAAAVAPGAGTAYDILLGSIDGATTLDARLTALETDNKIKIISRPRVVTLNNQAATIEALRILRVPLPSTGTVIATGAGGVAGSSQAATEKINTGITLTVTPQVSSDGFIFLDVFAKSSTTAPSSVASNTVVVPDEISRQAESHVLIKDGETFVLGGVYQDNLTRSEQGIPYLRSIPVLGWAFKSHTDNDVRAELLVFVTPKTIVGRGTEDVAQLPTAETLWQNRSQ
ncbi:MAG TPA: type IV pilus secretin PilQ [Candidatus Binatia bacterium]|jgi:type IV pilus assembly protein PilQ